MDWKDEALLCEGEQSCNRWMHRYCAGVSVEHYQSLDQSPLPFNCSLCVQSKQAAIIDELKSTTAALAAEVAELRAVASAQQQPNSNDNNQRKWSDVVARRPRRRPATRSQNHTTVSVAGTTGAAASDASEKVNQQKVARVKVPGVRRVWGTKKDASTTVVLQTISQLTKIDPEKGLTVKRKFQEGVSGRRDRWWFLIRSSEAILGELEGLWSCVSLQVGWKLEECTKPSNENKENEDTIVSENVHANSNNVEALDDSSNSPAPTNANSPKSSTNQPNDMETGNVDINNSIPNQSVSHSSHHNSASTASFENTDNNTFLDK